MEASGFGEEARVKDKLVTLIGGGGFLGRYIAQELLAAGARVRIAERDPRRAYFLKPLGGLGQTQFAACDVTKPDTVARAVAGSDAVVYLVGTWGPNFKGIQQDGAARRRRSGEGRGRRGVRRYLDDRRRPRIGLAILRDQGRGRSGGARGVPGRDDPAPLGRVRARGQVHQPLRRDGRRDCRWCRCSSPRRGSSRCMSSMSPRR